MSKKIGWLRSLLVILLLLVVVTIGGAYAVLRMSLPQSDGDFALKGLAAPVAVTRDALGVVSIEAQSREDAARALGFVHAQERFFEMDLMRRVAAGELAELFGAGALPADRSHRVHRFRARAEARLAASSDAERQLLNAYRDGVNAGLDALGARPFPYLLTRTTPQPWRSADSLLIVFAMYFDLQGGGNERELAMARMHKALPRSVYDFLTAGGSEWDAPLYGPAWKTPDLPPSSDIDLRNLPDELFVTQRAPRGDLGPGSNNFAVSGRLTENGAALVANDMHLGLRVPNIWFRARMVFPNPRRAGSAIDISGATLPGVPQVVVGSNGKIAWAFTNTYGDWMDWVRVELDTADPNRYRNRDGFAALQIHQETILVRGAAAETLTVRETEWGPIMATDADGLPLALAWVAHRPEGINQRLQDLETAETADEALTIANACGIPHQNFLVGDRVGNIGWTIAGRIPLRRGYDLTLPADWTQADVGWLGWLESAQYPLISNPVSDRLWTANARTLEGPGLDHMGNGGYPLGARARQIRDGMRERAKFSPADMLAIQLDDRALFLAHWHDLLRSTLAKAKDDVGLAELRRVSAEVPKRAAVDAVDYRALRAFRLKASASVLGGLAAAVRAGDADFEAAHMDRAVSQSEGIVWKILQQRPGYLLPKPFATWDDLLLEAARSVAAELSKDGAKPDAWTWGQANSAKIQHPLSRALPLLSGLLDMPADPLPGDSFMPRVQGPSFGASERFAVAPGHESEGYFHMPGGQSGHPLSPFYGAGHADWLAGKPTPFLPGPAQHHLNLRPAQ